MKVIINFGEKKVVVPCGIDGEISIRELIHLATAKYCKLSYGSGSSLNSDQVQLRLNNGAVVDPDDRVCDVADDREELFALITNSQQLIYPSHTTTINSNGELSSSVTSSNLSSSLSEHDRLITNRHEVIVTDADLRTRSLRVKNDPNNKMTHRQTYSPPTHDATKISLSNDNIGMFNISIDDKTGDKIFSIILPKENSPLGIHVIPYNNNEQQVNGLILQNIEDDGRIKRQGILQINDRIIEINRTNIERCSFDKAQLIFRTALLESELELKIIRKNPKIRSTLSEINQNTDLTFIDNDSNMNSLNTRRLGKIIKISLIKGNDGLGFKLASRDNPTGVANPIYVKTIFPKGAAIEDGRLQRGDRLLTVNSLDITQMSLQETVNLLRETHIGDTVELCISRQRDGSIPQDFIHDGKQIIDHSINEIKPDIMTFDIPLNDTSSAGLGITLKGKTSIIDGQSIDLGIFVKSILTGGAASRDNRLQPNDQLLVINDSSLINISNLEAAAILHEAVRREIHPGHIKVTISRLPITIDDSTKHVKEIDLSPSIFLNDENELDLTTFVPPPLARKPPTQQSNRHSSRLIDSDIRSSSPRSASTTTRSTRNSSPSKQQQTTTTPSDDIDSINNNAFERETPFRQSVSEKRRLTNQPNKQIIQWKQRSFHDTRTQIERKKPMRAVPDNNRSSPGLIRSSSFESIHKTNEPSNVQPINDEERKRQAKLRSRACNDSFRQAVDKSYGQNVTIDDDDDETTGKSEKQKFRFSNLFTTKAKREENRSIKSVVIQNPTLAQDNNRPPTFYPPPPPPPPQFTSRQDSTSSKTQNNDRPSYGFSYSEQQGYQPHRFDSSYEQPIVDHFTPTRYESQVVHTFQPNPSGKSSLSVNNHKPTHPPIPRQFFHANINGSQSLRQHQSSSHSSILPTSNRSTYPSTFTVQPSHFTSYSHNFDNPINAPPPPQQPQQQQQQTRRIGYTAAPVYPTSRNFFHLESPANV